MKLPRERLRKVVRLPAGERAILARAWILFLVVEVALRVVSLKRLLRLYRKLSRAGRACPTAGGPSDARLAWLVEVAGRYAPINATCLRQALVLSWLLGRRGVATALRIGVAREGGVLSAHAWLEREGEVISGVSDGHRYEPLRAGAHET